MVADERGVRDLDEGIVDLEEEDGLYPAALHVGERSRALQRREKAAVPVGAHEDVAGGVHDDLPVLRHSGPHPLGEEEHVLRVEPEVIVLLEAADRRLVVRLARHHVERNRAAIADGARENLAGMEVEERSARDRPDRVAALRPVVAEARALPARHEKRGDAACL